MSFGKGKSQAAAPAPTPVTSPVAQNPVPTTPTRTAVATNRAESAAEPGLLSNMETEDDRARRYNASMMG